MRGVAIDKGYKLSEYSLVRMADGKEVGPPESISCERDVFDLHAAPQTQPINAAAYVPVEACGAHEWSYIRRHGCAALAADVAASQARRRPHHRRLRSHQAHRRRAPAATLTARPPISRISHKS